MPIEKLIAAHRRAVTEGLLEAKRQAFFSKLIVHMQSWHDDSAQAKYEVMQPFYQVLSRTTDQAILALGRAEGFFDLDDSPRYCYVSAN